MNKLLYLFAFILLLSCSKDEIPSNEEEEMEETLDDCGVMNPVAFSVFPNDESVLVQLSSNGHWDGPFRSCPPESLKIYMSEDGNVFKKINEISGGFGTYLAENLVNGDIYYFKATALHSELDSISTETRMVRVGQIDLPSFIANPVSENFELFFLGPDNDKFIYRTGSDNWYLSAISEPTAPKKVVDDSFLAKWNPHNDNEITYREKQYIQISTNTNGVTSKSLKEVNLQDESQTCLHEISDNMDFGSEFVPEQYWIHDFDYSIDATSIFFKSNKDNGSTNLTEKKVFNNIWKLDLESQAIEPLSNFYPENFEMISFSEDPNAPNNFYILGGIRGATVEIEGAPFNPDQIDIYYYNTADQTLTLVLETIYEENFMTINPAGDKLIIQNIP